MRPIWGRQDPGGPHVGPMNSAIWVNSCSSDFDFQDVLSVGKFLKDDYCTQNMYGVFIGTAKHKDLIIDWCVHRSCNRILCVAQFNRISENRVFSWRQLCRHWWVTPKSVAMANYFVVRDDDKFGIMITLDLSVIEVRTSDFTVI